MDAIEKFRQFLNDGLKSLQEYVLLNKKILTDDDHMQNQNKQNSVFPQFDMMRVDLLSRDRNDYIRNTLIRLSFFKNFIRLTNTIEENQLFHDFKGLCDYLEGNAFPTSDVIQIIFFFIENNLKVIVKEVDVKTIPPFRFTIASVSEMAEFYQLSDEEISSLRMRCNDIEDCGEQIKTDESFVPTSQLLSTHHTIQKHYLDKLDTYTESDIKKVIDAFYQLKVPGKFCGKLERELRKELQKREKKSISIPKQESSNKKVSSSLLTDKEYKNFIKEIREYYNEYTGEVLKPMTKEGVTRIVSKMIWVGYTRKSINQFYQGVNKSMRVEKKDSITQFMEQYDQFEYYSKDNLEIQQWLEEATTYLYEIFGCFSEADYAFWYQEFQSVLLQMNWKIPNTFDYEYMQAQNLFEQEKQKRKN